MQEARRVLVVSGMHRSGTSLMAGLAAAAGIDMGSTLMPASRGNRLGHFEDLEFVRFHEECLERRGAGAFSPPDGGVTGWSAGELRQARELVDRRAGRPAWGFKDPRTALFLPLWAPLLPAPFFLLLYRHPAEVALSLLRRGIDLEVQLDPWTAVRAWTVYNRGILDFRRRCADRCLLLSVAGIRRDLREALALAAARSGLPLDRAGAAPLYSPDELRTGLAASGLDWRAVAPEAMELYALLEQAADLPAGAQDADPRSGATPRERGLQEASEHLLAAALAAGTAGEAAPRAAAALQERIDYSEMRLLIARQERRLEESGERIGRLTERLAELDRDQAHLAGTRAMRLVHTYWRAARRAQGWRRQTGWRLREFAGAAPPPAAEAIVVGCVAENEPVSLAQAFRLARSLRWFGGALADARMLVCVVGEVADDARARLAAAGAEVRVVERFDRRNPHANKLQFFAEAERAGGRGMLLLDCDTAVVRDPLPLLAGGAFQAKIADVASVPHEIFVRLFHHFGLALPRRRYRTTLLAQRTILYCNSGVVFLSSELAREFVPLWCEWNRRLLDAAHLLGPCAHHANQASLSLALAAHPIPFAEASAALNFPLHMTHLPRPPAVAAVDPAILHYHQEVDGRGRLLAAPYRPAQARIEALNRRLSDEG
jgi:hypothetical protein